MTNNQREIAETVFERNQRREAEINEALKQEGARRAAIVKNMLRLTARMPYARPRDFWLMPSVRRSDASTAAE